MATQLMNQLREVQNVIIWRRTIYTNLKGSRFVSRSHWRCQPLKRENRGSRLRCTERHVSWEQNHLSRIPVRFVSRFSKVRIWSAPCAKNRIQHTHDVRSYRGGTIMVWPGILLGTDLVLLDGFLWAEDFNRNVSKTVVAWYRFRYPESWEMSWSTTGKCFSKNFFRAGNTFWTEISCFKVFNSVAWQLH